MKNITNMCAIALLGVALGACSGDKLYGKELILTEVTSLNDVYREESVGKRLRVEGIVTGVCAKRGCWIEIGGEFKEGEEAPETVFFKVTDGEIVFPMSIMGSKVVAEGVLEELVDSIEELREEGAKHAAEAGEKFDPESITEAEVSWLFSGIGARVDS
ncbi:MAG: DUF4920 domain-containing protein [bacterium]|nr:DUF4920 domain-containing protein [bacterium]